MKMSSYKRMEKSSFIASFKMIFSLTTEKTMPLIKFTTVKVPQNLLWPIISAYSCFRLQIFHCLHHDGEGGETLLVDGFRAAYELKQRHPESFQRLSTLPIEAEYLEPGKHYFTIDSVLKLHPLTKKMQQIRYRRHIMWMAQTKHSQSVIT